MRKNTILVAAFLCSSWAQAQEDTTSSSLNEVVVTANKFPQKLSTTGKVITVITQQQLQRSAGKDLAQVLNEQSGITVSGANSNPGKDKSLFLRGASGNYTLFLLDGVPLNDPSGTGGTYDIRLISLEQIERIEILKGSQSTLYGANAIAGVINIITKKATTNKLSATGLASYGSYNTFKGAATVSQKLNKLDYNIGYEYFNTKGISEAKDVTGTNNFDKDGFSRHSLNAMVGVEVTDNIKLSPYYRFSEYKGEYDADAFTDGANEYDASLVNSGLLGTLKYKKGTVSVNYGYDYTKRSYQNQWGTTAYSGKFQHAEAYVHHTLTNYVELLAGVNYQDYQLSGAKNDNDIFSGYASLYIKSNTGFHLEAGGRFIHHDEAGNRVTYSVNPSYLINNNVKVFANLSTGFRPPSINELYGPYGANPDLTPETSRNLEGGVQVWTADRKVMLLANWFDRRLKNAIVYTRAYENRDKQHDFGAEAEITYAVNDRANLRASYTFVDGEVTQKLLGKDTTFYNLIRRPKNTFNFNASYQFTKNLFVSTTLQLVGERVDYYFDPVTYVRSEIPLKGFALWNAYAEYSLINNRLKVFADVKNIGNQKDYYEVYGYNVQGFNINGGVRFSL